MTNEQQQSPIFCLDKVKKHLYNTKWGIKPLLMLHTYVLRVQYNCGVVLVFWSWREIVIDFTYVFSVYDTYNIALNWTHDTNRTSLICT